MAIVNRSALAGVMALVFSVAACSDAGPALKSDSFEISREEPGVLVAESPAGDMVVVDMATGYVELPMDYYLPLSYARGRDLVDLATDLILEDCVAQKGLEFDIPDRPLRPWRSPYARRYGVLDPELVNMFGYGVPPTPELDAIQESQSTPLSDDVTAALYGPGGQTPSPGSSISPGACLGQISTLTGSDVLGDQSFQFAQEIARSSLRIALDDSRVKAAISEWGKCMTAAGIPTGNSDPIGFGSSEVLTATGGSSPNQIRKAQQDLHCKSQARLIETWALVEGEIQLNAITPHREELESLRARELDLLDSSAETIRNLSGESVDDLEPPARRTRP